MSSRRIAQPGVPGWVKLLLLLIVFLGVYMSARILLAWDRPNSDSDARVTVSIEPGSNLSDIIAVLDAKELVKDPWVFEIFVRTKGLGNKLQAGDYIIQRNLTFAEIVEVLQTGKSEEIKVTIPEGSTIEQIDEILTKRSLISQGDFRDCAATCVFSFEVDSLEGYLFPSTYFVNVKSFSSKKFIQRLYSNWRVAIDKYRIDIAPRTIDQVVKVASMIEREAFGDSYEEKQIISDIIWKRLDEGIHLGIDATTRYEISDWKRPLYTEDFAKDTPYNTRKRYGLPPTAISNPGEDSIRAAIYPKKSEYYYYLHDKKGQIHFGRNLEEHQSNKRKYLY